MKQRGFTLIELLVVIAIIAILAAILFPVFAQARAKARQASCTSNVKQLSLGVMMYIQDYDETFPFWNWGDSYGSGSRTPNHFESFWANAIYPYVKNGQVYACPSSNDRSTTRQNLMWAWLSSAQIPTSGIVPALLDVPINYGFSEPLESGNVCGQDGNHSGCTVASLDTPANTLVVADCNTGLTTGWVPSTNPTDPLHRYIISRVAYPNIPPGCWGATATCGATQVDVGDYRSDINVNYPIFDQQTRHSGGNLIGYGDGHAKFLKDNRTTWDLFNGYTGQGSSL
ncbi:MAG: prepilin-type N-terminal cleavage/methylation domain [Chthonomonadaceae bacterium]|nr:prepilin-type N-terminal cleavage/methylation domain [Chthonomonadaceae bacterium]